MDIEKILGCAISYVADSRASIQAATNLPRELCHLTYSFNHSELACETVLMNYTFQHNERAEALATRLLEYMYDDVGVQAFISKRVNGGSVDPRILLAMAFRWSNSWDPNMCQRFACFEKCICTCGQPLQRLASPLLPYSFRKRRA